MRAIRAYCPMPMGDFTQLYTLLPSTSHHLTTVLRMHKGDSLNIFDGKGNLFEAQIEAVGKQVVVKLVNSLLNETDSSLDTHLIIAVGKGDKMDWIMQKATELGVKSIQPVISQRSEVRLAPERWQKKHAHWQEIIINSCEQSGYNTLPCVKPICSFIESLQSTHNRVKLLFHPSGKSQKIKFLLDLGATAVDLLIGPEGGFTPQEIMQAEQNGFKLASLGPRILRMETAAISSIAVVQTLLGDI